MKILLLNNNPIINKLVTLSAQKTSDELDVVGSIDEISDNGYNLLIVDDMFYSEDLLQQIKEKTEFSKSLYICSKDSLHVEGFTSILKKPFLPTDLVELFSVFGKESDIVNLDPNVSDNDKTDTQEIKIDESLEEDEAVEDNLSDDKFLFDEDNISDNELSLDEDDISESVLDKEEVQEVQELLDETEEDFDFEEELELDSEDEEETKPEVEKELEETAEKDFDFEEELELDSEDEDEEAEPESEEELKETAEEDFDFEEELELDSEDEEEAEPESEEEIKLESEEELKETAEEDFNFEEELEPDSEDEKESEKVVEEDLEAQIQNAVEGLSEEDLESEVDEETLLNIATSEINSIDVLSSRDLKLAIGEEVEDIEDQRDDEQDLQEITEEIQPQKEESVKEDLLISDDENSGVESLKKLLKALSNEDVAASLKGMKININITLGDK